MAQTDNRLLELQRRYMVKIEKYQELVTERDVFIEWEKIHMASSSAIAYILAKMRKVDPVLAACASVVHDYGRVITGKQQGHAEAGYEPVKVFLLETGLFTREEVETIAVAVKNHSLKAEVGTALEEIVKDADVVDMYQHGYDFTRDEQRDRFNKISERW